MDTKNERSLIEKKDDLDTCWEMKILPFQQVAFLDPEMMMMAEEMKKASLGIDALVARQMDMLQVFLEEVAANIVVYSGFPDDETMEVAEEVD